MCFHSLKYKIPWTPPFSFFWQYHFHLNSKHDLHNSKVTLKSCTCVAVLGKNPYQQNSTGEFTWKHRAQGLHQRLIISPTLSDRDSAGLCVGGAMLPTATFILYSTLWIDIPNKEQELQHHRNLGSAATMRILNATHLTTTKTLPASLVWYEKSISPWPERWCQIN